MARSFTQRFPRLSKLIARYPQSAFVRPQIFATLPDREPARRAPQSGALAIESVTERFYFLLFGAIRAAWSAHVDGPAWLVSVRATGGAVGTGRLTWLKRSALVNWLWNGPWERAYGRLIDGVAYRSATLAHPLADLRDWLRAGALWRAMRSTRRCDLTVDGIALGDLIIDTYLRFKPAPAFDIDDRFVRQLIWQALRDVRQASAWFATHRPRAYLTSYTTYVEHGVAARVALREGIPVWTFGSLSRVYQRISLDHHFHTPDASAYRRIFESLDDRAGRLAQAEAQLGTRLSGGVDVATSYMRQSSYGDSAKPLPADLAGAVVIFLHDFYDSPHIYADLVFDDFMQWVRTSIETLHAAGTTVYIKPHPNQISLSAGVLDTLRADYPDAKWLGTDANNVRLAQAGIACGLTVYGTVAHELAYLGVPVITCARHPHHTFDFCRNAGSREQYVQMLQTPAQLPISREAMREQALAFYYMHNLYGDPEERELHRRYVAFWRACHIGDAEDSEILATWKAFVTASGFDRMIARIAGEPESDSADAVTRTASLEAALQ